MCINASQIVTASYTDLQDYTYYFVPAPWLSVKLLRLLQNYPPPGEAAISSLFHLLYPVKKESINQGLVWYYICIM